MPASRPTDQPWYHSLTLDLLLRVLNNSIFHPFVASLLPLCLRAAETPYSEPAFKNTVYWAIFICILHALAPLNERLAYGAPRVVENEEEVVVITGGASGLGKCLAETYALKGVDVVVLDVTNPKAAGVAEGVKYFQCDIGDRGVVKGVWGNITKEIGVPTVLIHCAGIVHGKKLLQLNGDNILESYRTNVMAQYTLNQLFLSPLRDRPSGGTLVTVSSVLARLGASQLSAYSATKAALLAHHASLAAELAPYPHIKTILVAPGQLSTEMFAGLERRQGPLQRFFGPIVDVTELAMKLVKMIGEGRGGVLAEPAYARWIGVLDLLPVGMQKVVRGWSGVDEAMIEFRPRGQDISESVVMVEKP